MQIRMTSVAVDADLLRQLLGRQMIGHVAPLVGVQRKSPPRSLRRRAGVLRRILRSTGMSTRACLLCEPAHTWNDRGSRRPSGKRLPGTIAALGVWRSLVARSVRVGEAPSSNLGTPIYRGGTGKVPPRPVSRAARPIALPAAAASGCVCPMRVRSLRSALLLALVAAALRRGGGPRGPGADRRGGRRHVEVDRGHGSGRECAAGPRGDGGPDHAAVAAGADGDRRRATHVPAAGSGGGAARGSVSCSRSSGRRARRR